MSVAISQAKPLFSDIDLPSRPQATLPAAINKYEYEDMSQKSLREFFSPASTSGNGSEDDSESEEEEEQQHAPSNSCQNRGNHV